MCFVNKCRMLCFLLFLEIFLDRVGSPLDHRRTLERIGLVEDRRNADGTLQHEHFPKTAWT